MDSFLDLIFIPKCMFCSSVGRYICSSCLLKMSILEENLCVVCGCPSEHGFTHQGCKTPGSPSQLLTVFNYCTLVRTVIKRSKYKNKEFLGLKIISELGAELCKEELVLLSDYLLVPVPISRARLKDRGFNQVETIVKAISKRTGQKVKMKLIQRSMDTKAQYTYTRKERFANVAGVFTVSLEFEKFVLGRKFLVVDDICTSGATLLEASKVLYKYGAKDVKCFALSKKL